MKITKQATFNLKKADKSKATLWVHNTPQTFMLETAIDFLSQAEKQIVLAGETELAIEVQKLSLKILDRREAIVRR